jgi:PAS domain S-box-containing protein
MLVSEPLSDPAFPGASFIHARGDVAALMRRHDWSRSPLGPPAGWPQSLRSVVDLLLGSKFPMFVAWGPDLGFLYNDAYAEILGAKHPASLGARFYDIWSEIWPDISPLIDAAMAGEATWREDLPLVMNRRGFDEQTWFTFSYSPVRDESGEVAGMFCAVAETTGRVLAERREAAEKERCQRSEEQLRLAIDAGEVGLWDVDVSSWEVFWDSRVRAMFGVPDEAHVALEDFYGAMHPDDQDRVAAAFEAAIDPGRRAPYAAEYRVIGKDGQLRWIAAKGRALFDAQGACLRVLGTAVDITERKKAEQHLRLMVNELNHRVKNSLATVQGITTQTLGRGEIPADVREALTARLVALAQAHDVLTGERWSGADLRELAERAAAPWGSLSGSSPFVIDGPGLYLQPNTAIALSLVFHELATNAAKYGALSASGGQVRIAWSIERADGGRRLQLVWSESGGPAVSPPGALGFGTRLIQRGLAAELNGSVAIDYPTQGVICTMQAVLPDEPGDAWQDLQLT